MRIISALGAHLKRIEEYNATVKKMLNAEQRGDSDTAAKLVPVLMEKINTKVRYYQDPITIKK